MVNPEEDYNPRKAIETLSANLEQPHKFAQIFCEAARQQKAIDEVLKEAIKFLIKNDEETRGSIKVLLRDIEKEDWKFYLKKIGFAGWGLLMLIIGAILNGLSKKFFG